MSGDISMVSDDDRPILAKSGPSNQNGNGHATPNGKSRYGDGSSSLSEDDGDVPLVSPTVRCVRFIEQPLTVSATILT